MWCQYTLIKCNNSPFPEVDVLRQISLQRFMPPMYFSVFPSASCAEHQCPLWEDHGSAGLLQGTSFEYFYTSTLQKAIFDSETHRGAKSPFSFSSSS